MLDYSLYNFVQILKFKAHTKRLFTVLRYLKNGTEMPYISNTLYESYPILYPICFISHLISKMPYISLYLILYPKCLISHLISQMPYISSYISNAFYLSHLISQMPYISSYISNALYLILYLKCLLSLSSYHPKCLKSHLVPFIKGLSVLCEKLILKYIIIIG